MSDNKGWSKYWGSDKTVRSVTGVNTSYPEVVSLMLRLTNKKSKCIELGCGSGIYALELIHHGRNCIASDYSESALEAARLKGQKLFGITPKTKRVDVYKIPYKQGHFDMIFSDGLIEHLDLDKALKEIRRVTRKGGYVVSKVPSGNWLYNIIFWFICLFHWRDKEQHFSMQGWKEIFERNGFRNVKVSACGSVLMGIRNRLWKTGKLDWLIPKLGKIYYLIEARK
jgi:ubiquinone/menaquinone biosynthesis C-methylase UbiE